MKTNALRVEKQTAEEAKKKLLEKNLLNRELETSRNSRFVFFPITSTKIPVELKKTGRVMQIEAKKIIHPASLKKSLPELSEKELAIAPSSYDVIGKIIIITIPKKLEKKKKIIAKKLLELNKNIETVCEKTRGRTGKYRKMKLKVIMGKKNLETTCKENNCVFLLDVSKTYFSPRLSNERKRIFEQVKANEIVCVPFAGIGPFAIEIAKNTLAEKVIGIELNPEAVKYFEKNIELNKAHEKVIAIKGDVKKILGKKYKNCFDRIAMPLPKGGENFLKNAIKAIKNNGIIHFYHFAPKEKAIKETIELIEKECKKNKAKCRVINSRIIRSYSAAILQTVVDFHVKK